MNARIAGWAGRLAGAAIAAMLATTALAQDAMLFAAGSDLP